LLGLAFNFPAMHFNNWNEAFHALAQLTSKGRVVILLDEISWMAGNDKDFAGKLKGAWDTLFKKNNKLVMIICGSVTSWIEENILNNKDYVGRISLSITLEEMPLYDANKFWDNKKLISSYEKFKILCITGGVPRYLEEIRPNETAEENIKRLCFSKDGVLFTEFDKIFKDIFESRAEDYKNIVRKLADKSMEVTELCESLGVTSTGGFSKKLKDLATARFITRDFVYDGKSKSRGLSRYRLSDNYIRFYLKYIEPKSNLIEKGLYDEIDLERLSGWYSIMGLQFQNLVLNNLPAIIKQLKIPAESIISASPYFQNKTKNHKACQIDLLIQTKHSLYVCEIKFRKKIPSSVIEETLDKINKLKRRDHYSVRPVLIYQGELSIEIEKSDFFAHLIPFEKLLDNN